MSVGLIWSVALAAVGILGILKAGGAYVPLDPTYPQARLAEMLDGWGGRALAERLDAEVGGVQFSNAPSQGLVEAQTLQKRIKARSRG